MKIHIKVIVIYRRSGIMVLSLDRKSGVPQQLRERLESLEGAPQERGWDLSVPTLCQRALTHRQVQR